MSGQGEQNLWREANGGSLVVSVNVSCGQSPGGTPGSVCDNNARINTNRILKKTLSILELFFNKSYKKFPISQLNSFTDPENDLAVHVGLS